MTNLQLTLNIELNNSSLSIEEAQDRLERAFSRYYSKEFSTFIVMLLRETRSSTWELKEIKIEEKR